MSGVIPSLGSGTRPIDWLYVSDVCDAFVRAATGRDARGRVLDIGSGQTATVADVVTELAELAGYRGPLGFGEVADRRHDVAHVADTGPAAECLGWRARTPLHTGLAWTLAWYRAQHGCARDDGRDRSLAAIASEPSVG